MKGGVDILTLASSKRIIVLKSDFCFDIHFNRSIFK
jgi:hypothetical protein